MKDHETVCPSQEKQRRRITKFKSYWHILASALPFQYFPISLISKKLFRCLKFYVAARSVKDMTKKTLLLTKKVGTSLWSILRNYFIPNENLICIRIKEHLWTKYRYAFEVTINSTFTSFWKSSISIYSRSFEKRINFMTKCRCFTDAAGNQLNV